MKKKQAIIEVHALTKRYGDLTAVDRVTFSVFKGEVFAFLGPNGAGKTTTLEILQGLRRPTSGTASVLGFDVTSSKELGEIRKRIGVLPQEFSALDKLTVRENVALFASMYESSRDPDELIELLDLSDKADVRFDRLSGGLKQKVGIAASLVNDPEVVFLDEPTTGLDPRSRRAVWNVIDSLRKSGTTIVLTTHYMEEAERLADRIAIIHRGKISALGTASDLINRYGGNTYIELEDVRQGLLDMIRRRFPSALIDGESLLIPVVETSQVLETIGELVKMSITGGIRVRNPTIEDVFLSVVGGRITEEGEVA